MVALKMVQQAGARQRIAAGAQPPERHAPLGEPPQRREQRRRHGLAHVDAAADEQDVDRAQFIERAVGESVSPLLDSRGCPSRLTTDHS